jgi:tRNA A-37 threonylcarbamoyl transferase component Bud32/tetratricopeptide (TPR) repeat protein
MPNACPTPAELRDYSAGRLEPIRAAAVSDHIEECAACLHSLRIQHSFDSLEGMLRRQAREAPQQLGAVSGSDNDGAAVTLASPLHGGSSSSSTLDGRGANAADTAGLSSTHPERAGVSPAKRFGGYELLEEIARGGMGVVFKARQIKLNRIVAIKMILAGQFASKEEVERFYGEAKSAARLDHRGIVPIYEVDEFEGKHFFSMGFIEGESLEDRLSRGRLPQREAASLLGEICDAVQYAHEHGIIHRDLKPRNILIASDGSPKVTDFGLAKSIEAEGGLTVSGQILGTPGYMPPEQASGKPGEIGPGSDVYSLGAILYCMLTGRPPFRSDSVVEVIKQVLESTPERPRKLERGIAVDLETICLKCLEKEPRHRYASVAALRDELRRYLRGDPIQARSIGAPTRAWRWVRQRPLAAATAGLLATLLLTIPVTVVVAKRSGDARRIAALHSKIEAGLDAPQLTQAWLEEMDRHLALLAADDAPAAAEVSHRLADAWSQAIRTQLEMPHFGAEQAASIAAALDLFADRDPPLVRSLRQQLDQRKTDWQRVIRVAAPFNNLGDLFQSEVTLVDGDRLLNPHASATQQRVLTTALSGGLVQCEARFDDGWEKAARIGVSLKTDGERGYAFVLQTDDTRTQAGIGSFAFVTDTSQSFEKRRTEDGPFYLVIFRNGVPLLRQAVAHQSFAQGPLVLRGTCENSQLRIEINSLPAATIRDPFPLSSKQEGKVALEWPQNVGLLSVEVRRKPKPQAESPLEKGDELFDAEQYDLALEQYRSQRVADRELQQEILYKEALCELKLGRAEDAAALLATVANDRSGEVWPPLAGCHLWVLHLRAKRRAEADRLFDDLSTRFTFRNMAELIPLDLRQEILSNYGSEMGTVAELLRPDPDRIARVTRFTAIDRFLTPDGRGSELQQMDAARAYELEGDLGSAVEVAARIARDSRQATVVRHYLRFLRLNGQADVALNELELYSRQRANPQWDDPAMMAVERARIHAALKQWSECEQALDEACAALGGNGATNPDSFTYYALIKGMLQYRRGEVELAEATWKSGYIPMRSAFSKASYPSTALVNAAILGSLSNEMQEQEAQAFFNCIANRGGNNPLIRQLQAYVAVSTVTSTLRQMWRSPLGRTLAEDFAFERIGLRERIKLPAILMSAEYVSQTAFGGQASAAQQEAVYQLMSEAYDLLLVEGTLKFDQLTGLLFTWKLPDRWTALRATLVEGAAENMPEKLPKALWGGLGYVFAHKWLMQNPDPTVVAEALAVARDDCQAGSPFAQLAAQDIRLLNAKQGVLSFSLHNAEPVELQIENEGQPLRSLRLTGPMEIEVPQGKCQIVAQDAKVFVEPATIEVRPARHLPVLVKRAK